MKPRLVIGLGNPLMGDDGIGSVLAERLAADPRLPPDTEVFIAGTDLLRCTAHLEGRTQVVILDAIESPQPAWGLSHAPQHAHHLSLIDSVRLLHLLTPAPVTILAIAIESARAEPALSPGLEARVPQLLDQLLAELARLPLGHDDDLHLLGDVHDLLHQVPEK